MSASRKGVSSRWALLSLAVILLAAAPAVPQPPPRPGTPPPRPAPRLEPVAETRLLMDGLTRANYQDSGSPFTLEVRTNRSKNVFKTG